MRIPVLMIGALASALWLAACTPAAETPETAEAAPAPAGPVGFAYTAEADLEGGYSYPREGAPDTGRFTLVGLQVGSAEDFAAWEAGGRATPPVVLILTDRTSAPANGDVDGEDGARLTLAPTAYAVSNRAISIMATSEETGEVLFEGVLDPAALETARSPVEAVDPDAGRPEVMSGALSIGDQTWRHYRFHWTPPGEAYGG